MKKNLTLMFFFLCIGTSSVYAQIEINSDRSVLIGDHYSLVDINAGKTTIRNDQGLNLGFEFYRTVVIEETEPGGPTPQPTQVMVFKGLTGGGLTQIGKADDMIWRMYARHYYTDGYNPGIISISDSTLKANVRELSNISERVSKLRPVMYDFVKNGSGVDVSKDPAAKNRVGFIAQEVKEIFPELVVVGADQLHRMDYTGLIPYLTKTVQEQNMMLQQQNEKIEEILVQNKKMEQQILELQNSMDVSSFDVTESPMNAQGLQKSANATANTIHKQENRLYQNTPNPFTNSTTIAYQLAGNVTNAKICIYNLTGKQLQCYELSTNNGENAIEVRASSLQAGMYLYSLLVDGKLIDTKRMVLTE